MGEHHIPLDKASQRLCTTVLPWYKVSQMQWGKVSQMQLPMGVDVTPDIFQSTRMDKKGDIELVQAYMDETLIITNGMSNEHMQQLETVLQKA
jgi:hypothetical protein